MLINLIALFLSVGMFLLEIYVTSSSKSMFDFNISYDLIEFEPLKTVTMNSEIKSRINCDI